MNPEGQQLHPEHYRGLKILTFDELRRLFTCPKLTKHIVSSCIKSLVEKAARKTSEELPQ